MSKRKPPDKKRKRATKAERQKRIDLVIKCLRQGFEPSQIRQLLIEREEVSEKTAQRTIKEAWDILAALGGQANDQQLGLIRVRLDYLFSTAIAGEHKDLDKAIKLLALQLQLQSKQKGELPHAKPGNLSATDTLTPHLAEIFDKLGGHESPEGP